MKFKTMVTVNYPIEIDTVEYQNIFGHYPTKEELITYSNENFKSFDGFVHKTKLLDKYVEKKLKKGVGSY